MKVKLNCVYQTKKKHYEAGAIADLPKDEAERLLASGLADKPAPAPKAVAVDGGEDAGDGDNSNGDDAK